MPGLLPLLTTTTSPAKMSPWAATLPGDRRHTRRGALRCASAGIAAAAIFTHRPVFAGTTSEATGCDPEEERPGLISDDHWQGPTFGLDVSWDTIRWSIGDRSNPGVANAIGREDQPVDCGFGQGGSDRLMLVNSMWESGVLVIESYDRLMWTSESMADAMTQPGWVQNLRVAEDSDLLLAEASGESLAAVARDADDPDHTVYWQATFPADDESVIHQLTLHMWESGAVYALHDIEGVTIVDLDPFAVVDLETVQQVLDDWQG